MDGPPTIRRVAVVGAGISGLVAARRLVAAGVEVVVLDKSRGIGGRMSTRRLGDAVLDHGAQFFTARDRRFRPLVDEWVEAGVAVAWHVRQIDGSDEPCFRGATGMTAVPKHLARGLDVRLGQRVLGATLRADRFVVETEQGGVHEVDALLLTPPAPQSLDVVDGGGIVLDPVIRARLEAIAYDPCFAVLALLDGPSLVPGEGGFRPREGPIAFLADNHRKGISPRAQAVTIHARRDWSRRRLDADRDEIARDLIDAARPWLGAKVIEFQIHRWLHARPVRTQTRPYLAQDAPAPALFAGDAFGGPRVEGAALSGLAAAEHLLGLRTPRVD